MHGRFAALLDGRLLCESRAPLLSAARILRAEGIPGDTLLEMAHPGSREVALRSTVGIAAGLRVSEVGTPRFVPWRPDELPANSRFPCTVPRLDGKTRPLGWKT